jgi:glycogen synthase
MKILMTADTIGGVWTYALELAGELHHQGIEVALATMGDPPRAQQRREASAIPSLTLYESTYKLEWMDDPWADVQQAGEWLLYLEETVRPDVVHLNGYVHAHLPWKAPTLVIAHSCVVSWWQAVKKTLPPDSWKAYAAAVGKGLAAADMVVAPTQAMLDSIFANYGAPALSHVVPNGRHVEVPDSGPKWPFVISAGRLWDEAKNVRLLEEAAPKLSWPVWLAGETMLTQSQPFRQRNVNLLGPLPFRELARWLGRAAIYALPARYEPFGLSALEAALCGCALVLGDIDSLREVWGKNALYVAPDDADELADAIENLIMHPDRCHKLGQMARERGLKYSPQRMATAYIALYRRLTAETRVGLQEAACAS